MAALYGGSHDRRKNITPNYGCDIKCNPMLLIVLYLYRMCQCRLHVVLWSNILMLMHVRAAEFHSTTGHLFPSQFLCGTILVTLY